METPPILRKVARKVIPHTPYWVKGQIQKYWSTLVNDKQPITAGGRGQSGEQQPLIENDPLSQKFWKLGPWLTLYEINGKKYGGTFNYDGDFRLRDFFEWLDVSGSVVELGSFEAGHTVRIAKDDRVQSVLGLDGRNYLVARGRFIKSVLKSKKISFGLCDFEMDNPRKFGKFDVAFSSGLLYHLEEPWRHLQQLSQTADRLFLSTHYSTKNEVTYRGYEGRMRGEFGFFEPLSGLKEQSFWPTLDSLKKMLLDSGFELLHVKDYAQHVPEPLANFYCKSVHASR
jgi:hypothetical protein